MKFLQDYITDVQTALFKECSTFFAFSNEQAREALNKLEDKDSSHYVNMGAGMICLESKAKDLLKGLDEIYEAGIKQDLADNKKQGVVERELANHEYCITGDITDTVNALVGYNITEKEIKSVAWGCIIDD